MSLTYAKTKCGYRLGIILQIARHLVSYKVFCNDNSVTGCTRAPRKEGFIMESRTQGVQNSRCPGNIKNIGCLHPHKSELGDGTHGAGPLRVVLHSKSFTNNFRNGYLTYL